MAENIAQQFKVIDDEKLTAYLNALGNRIVEHLPPTSMKFRFYLVELPEVNAFSISGGRVYVARKMVALTQNDDELAGVIAHELGHIVTHQQSIFVTRRFHDVLEISQVSDRRDIFNKYHQLLENSARKPARVSPEKEQYVADQVALFAMARAGYAPHAYVDLWDRFQQTHGKTGSWLSNLLGDTKPEQRRLGEMVKNVTALPRGCSDIPPGSRSAEFAKWQTEVIHYTPSELRESIPGLLSKSTLSLPLRPDVSNLRFSGDGKYILAQDEGGIHVLSRDPFSSLFFIPATDMLPAKFSADSRSIVFYNKALRVEVWSIAEQKRSSVYELTVLNPCLQTEISPDGSVLACLDSELQLSLRDVSSGRVLTSKKSFLQQTFFNFERLLYSTLSGDDNPQIVEMHFSPDNRFFVAGFGGGYFFWDVGARRELSLPGSIRDIVGESFAFVTPDRIVGIASSAGKSPILRFPSGEWTGQVRLAHGISLRDVAKGNYVMVGPVKDHPMALFDLSTGRMPLEYKTEAADIYEGTMVSERVTGELGLYSVGESQPLATTKLPESRLGSLQAVAVSPDFNWMAMSNRTRGAVWDIVHNIRTMQLRSFRGAWAGDDAVFYVDLSKFADAERQVIRLSPVAGTGAQLYKLGDTIAAQLGPYLVITNPKQRPQFGPMKEADIEIQDVRDRHPIWKHHFAHDIPFLFISTTTVLLIWPSITNGAREELQHFPELRNGGADSDSFCELRDLKTDATVAKLRIPTNKGSFQIKRVFSTGKWLIASATQNQVLTYDLATGEQKGHFFGAYPTATENDLLAVNSESRHVKLYDLTTMQLRQEYIFADAVVFKSFSPDGKRLLVVTASQTIYIVDTSP